MVNGWGGNYGGGFVGQYGGGFDGGYGMGGGSWANRAENMLQNNPQNQQVLSQNPQLAQQLQDGINNIEQMPPGPQKRMAERQLREFAEQNGVKLPHVHHHHGGGGGMEQQELAAQDPFLTSGYGAAGFNPGGWNGGFNNGGIY
jgi:hypothetical protein